MSPTTEFKKIGCITQNLKEIFVRDPLYLIAVGMVRNMMENGWLVRVVDLVEERVVTNRRIVHCKQGRLRMEDNLNLVVPYRLLLIKTCFVPSKSVGL